MNTIDPMLLTTILRRTRDLVAQGWCQGDFAQTKTGEIAYYYTEEACRWCLAGAAYAAIQEQHERVTFPLVHAHLMQFIPISGVSVSDYNDDPDTTQQDVLALLDRAIAGVKP